MREGACARAEFDDGARRVEVDRCQHRVGQRWRAGQYGADGAGRTRELLEEQLACAVHAPSLSTRGSLRHATIGSVTFGRRQ
jgi:hypothetical protein